MNRIGFIYQIQQEQHDYVVTDTTAFVESDHYLENTIRFDTYKSLADFYAHCVCIYGKRVGFDYVTDTSKPRPWEAHKVGWVFDLYVPEYRGYAACTRRTCITILATTNGYIFQPLSAYALSNADSATYDDNPFYTEMEE